jgi:hypothetical protein
MIRSPKTRLLARAAVEHLEAVAEAFTKRLFLLFTDDLSFLYHTYLTEGYLLRRRTWRL